MNVYLVFSLICLFKPNLLGWSIKKVITRQTLEHYSIAHLIILYERTKICGGVNSPDSADIKRAVRSRVPVHFGWRSGEIPETYEAHAGPAIKAGFNNFLFADGVAREHRWTISSVLEFSFFFPRGRKKRRGGEQWVIWVPMFDQFLNNGPSNNAKAGRLLFFLTQR